MSWDAAPQRAPLLTDREWRRLIFLHYLIETGRVGRGDVCSATRVLALRTVPWPPRLVVRRED